jgi:TonB family protein
LGNAPGIVPPTIEFEIMSKLLFLFLLLGVAHNIVLAQDAVKSSTWPPSEEEPIPLNLADIRRSIEYPKEARDQGIQGKVLVKVLIDTLGNLEQYELVNSAHPLLVQAVEAKLPTLRFSPARKDGHRQKFWVTLPFQFTLQNSEEKPTNSN